MKFISIFILTLISYLYQIYSIFIFQKTIQISKFYICSNFYFKFNYKCILKIFHHYCQDNIPKIQIFHHRYLKLIFTKLYFIFQLLHTICFSRFTFDLRKIFFRPLFLPLLPRDERKKNIAADIIFLPGRCVCLYKRHCGSSKIALCSTGGNNVFENIYFLREMMRVIKFNFMPSCFSQTFYFPFINARRNSEMRRDTITSSSISSCLTWMKFECLSFRK